MIHPQNAETAKNPDAALVGRAGVLEPKWDGIRILAHVAEDGVHTYTRTGKSQDGKLPAIEAELAALFPVGSWVDGEAVGFIEVGGKEVQDWGAAQSCLGSGTVKAAANSTNIKYVIFDMMFYGDLDIRPLSLKERREALEKVIAGNESDKVMLSPQLEATQENHEALVAEGYEGSMVKTLNSPYMSGKRGKGWYKLKATDEADVVVMGFKPGQNGFAGMVGAIEFGQYRNGALEYRGRCSGMTMQVRQDMTANPDKYLGTAISVAYMGIMPSGALRHPQFKRHRTDKPVTDCDWTTC